MPVLRDISLGLSLEDIVRREQGASQRKVHPQILKLRKELLAQVERGQLLLPAIAFEVVTIAESRRDRLILADSQELEGRMLCARFGAATKVAMVAGTIGPRLDEQVAQYHACNDDLRALLLDGIGNAAVDALSRAACQRIHAEALSLGLQASSTLSPGLHGLPLSNQWVLFRLVDGARIGIRLTPAAMMVPGKSISMLIGLGQEMPQWSRAQACAWCNMSQHCAYRVFV